MVSYLNTIHMSDNGKIRKYTEPKENEISEIEKKNSSGPMRHPTTAITCEGLTKKNG